MTRQKVPTFADMAKVRLENAAAARAHAARLLAEADAALTEAIGIAHENGLNPSEISRLAGLARPTVYDRLAKL